MRGQTYYAAVMGVHCAAFTTPSSLRVRHYPSRINNAIATPLDEAPDCVDVVTTELVTADVCEVPDESSQSALASRLAGGFGPTVWSEFGGLASELGTIPFHNKQTYLTLPSTLFLRLLLLDSAESCREAECSCLRKSCSLHFPAFVSFFLS